MDSKSQGAHDWENLYYKELPQISSKQKHT